jgi:hypothetical protein
MLFLLDERRLEFVARDPNSHPGLSDSQNSSDQVLVSYDRHGLFSQGLTSGGPARAKGTRVGSSRGFPPWLLTVNNHLYRPKPLFLDKISEVVQPR